MSVHLRLPDLFLAYTGGGEYSIANCLVLHTKMPPSRVESFHVIIWITARESFTEEIGFSQCVFV